MKKLLALVFISVAILTTAGCSEQNRAKNWGGEYNVELPADTKLVNVTFKENDIWYLTKPMTEDDIPETYTFTEDSNWGVLEGTVTITESKTVKGGK